MITLSKVSEFLKSTFGETIKVMFGILIALQINNWSDQAKQNKEEVRILSNLKEDLLNDIFQLENNVLSADKRQQNIDSIFTILYMPDKYDTDTFLHLNFALAGENHFDLSSGTFDESMAAGTINCIKNNSIRQQIFNYYRITKRNYTDKNTIKQIYENIFPHFFKILVPSQEFIGNVLKKRTHLPNLKIEELALNKGYIAILTLKYRTEYHQISSWEKYISLAKILLENIKNELKNKS
jgi:hypothetical protein